jgi:hypothetical protein
LTATPNQSDMTAPKFDAKSISENFGYIVYSYIGILADLIIKFFLKIKLFDPSLRTLS